jgi:hypothetical protein
MKAAYVKNIPMAHGEISLVTSKNAEHMTRHACKLAEQVNQSGMNVMLINCGMSENRFFEFAHEETSAANEKGPKSDSHVPLILHSSVRGNLIGESEGISQKIAECKIGVVIISGWEWASNSYRRKERLLYYLRELITDKNIAIVVYAITSTKPTVGEYDRGGVGRLALLVFAIAEQSASEFLDDVVPKPPPVVITKEEERAAERSAQLLINKINEIERVNQDIPVQSESRPPIESERHTSNGIHVNGKAKKRK